MPKKYKIVYDKQACIGAAACAAVAPEFWVMKDDGKAHLQLSKDEDGKEVLIITDDQLSKEGRSVLEANKEAAEVCPVQVIHIYDEESGEKII